MSDPNLTFDQAMSDTEALMWNIEKDPWLNPSGAMIIVVDKPINVNKFRRRIAHAVLSVPRLRQRVEPGFGRFTNPTWALDADLDLNYHLRHLALPDKENTDADLRAMAARIGQTPFDRTRPLWEMHIVDNLEGGRGALIAKLHHSITDGAGAMRMSLAYLDFERKVGIDPKIDLSAALADMAEEAASSEHSAPTDAAMDLAKGLGKLARRQLKVARFAAAEVATWGADPERITDAVGKANRQFDSMREQLGFDGHSSSGSPLWRERSRHRHLEVLELDLNNVKAAAHKLDGTINDFFVAGAVHGAALYHHRRNADVATLNVSFVVSTKERGDRSAANGFTPALIAAPAGPMSAADRFGLLSNLMAARRRTISGGGLLAGASSMVNLMPTSVVTKAARAQGARIDIATSNFRGSPTTVYVAGSKVLAMYTLGPVAGTAFNLTTLSYDGKLQMGMHVDPVAVTDPADLRDCIQTAFEELMA